MSQITQPTTPIRKSEPSSTTPARVPVVVVTGYLGSGKTTLISSLLNQPDMAGTAVIVNELAEAGIDQSIIGDAGADAVLLLSNGCLCCGSGTDLRNAVARLLATPLADGKQLQRILVETSGVADPGPILKQICFDPVLRSKLRYAGVVTLFDVQHGQDMLARDPVGFRQIALADHILLTKTDITGKTEANKAYQFLKALNPNADISRQRTGTESFIMQAGRGVMASGASAWLGTSLLSDTPIETAHQQILSTWSIFGDSPISWRQVEHKFHLIFDQHGDNLLRTKGLLWTTHDERPLVIHGINRHFHRPVRLNAWDGIPQSRVVVIGFEGASVAAAQIADVIGGEAKQYLSGSDAVQTEQMITGEQYEHAT